MKSIQSRNVSCRQDAGISKIVVIAGMGVAAFSASSMAAETRVGARLSAGHTDIGIGFQSGVFELHIHNEEADEEFEPGDAALVVPHLARTTAPSDPRFAFLGAAGTPIWVLPQVENEQLLFLGISGEEIEMGIFAGEQVQLTLNDVRGPGDVFVYTTSGVVGDPDIRMNSRDGISAADSVLVRVGAHNDYNWAFSAPGIYRLTFVASGTLVEGQQPVASEPVDYTFEVLAAPELKITRAEPGEVALIWVGLPGETYQFQTSPTVDGNWADEGPPVPAINGTMRIDIATTDLARFFRLITAPSAGAQ